MSYVQYQRLVESDDICFENALNKSTFKEDFKKYLYECFGFNKNQLKSVKKRFVIEKRVDGHLKEILSDVKDESKLFIGSKSRKTFLFGTLKKKDDRLEFDGLTDKNGIKAYIYVIDKDNKVRHISHNLQIIETEKKITVRSVDYIDLNEAIEEFIV